MSDSFMCECECSCDPEIDAIFDEQHLQTIVCGVLSAEGIKRPCMLSVSYVSDIHMQKINHTYRGTNEPTDVISIECERPDDPDLFENEPCELGDILLAPEYIQRQSELYHTSFTDEATLLLVHGLLHLLGYDHTDDKTSSNMEKRTLEILGTIQTDGTIDNLVLTRHREGTID